MANYLSSLLQAQVRSGNSAFYARSSVDIQNQIIDAIETFAYTDRATNTYRRNVLNAYAAEVGMKRVITAFGVYTVNDLFWEVLRQVPKEIAKEIRVFTDLTSGSITRNREARLKRLHEEIAQDAIRAVARAYRARSPQRNTLPYRVNEKGRDGKPVRYAGGALLKALQDPRMYRVQRDGLDFIDPIYLDKAAAQWYRLNFGAGSRGANTKRPPQTKMIIFGQTITPDIGLERFGPSGAFSMPAGFWISQETGGLDSWRKGATDGEFWWLRPGRSKLQSLIEEEQQARTAVQKGDKSRRASLLVSNVRRRGPISLNNVRSKRTVTAGIEGSRFLDAGANRINKTLPLKYMELFDEWFSEYERTGGGPVAAERVKGSRNTIEKAGRRAKSELERLSRQSRLAGARAGSRFNAR